MRKRLVIFIIVWSIFFSCSVNKKLKSIKDDNILPELFLDDYKDIEIEDNIDYGYIDSISTGAGESVIMNAVVDDQTGEMVATDELDGIYVRATFRNVAERNGNIDLGFELIVPSELTDPNWQLRFQPTFHIMQDTLYSDKVLITGEKFRKLQEKGYDQYAKYMSSIIDDSLDFASAFTYEKIMNNFIKRRYAKDSLWLQDALQDDIILDYYTKNRKFNMNQRRKERADHFFRKFVKTPMITEGVRLDSVVKDDLGNIRYYYVQTIRTVTNLKRVNMVLSADIISFDKDLYRFPIMPPLTYYVSSLSNLADFSDKYIYKVLERNLTVTTSAYIDFIAGKHNIIDSLHNNKDELERIKENICDILNDPILCVDSLVVTAACSPEGSYNSNNLLAQKRAVSVKEYLGNSLEDSITIKVNWIAEDWERLNRLINSDTNLVDRDFLLECFKVESYDEREMKMRGGKDYVYLRSTLYPYLRSVKLDFHLHRRGMLKDTIHTREIDMKYAEGIDCLKNGNYKGAVNILREYKDINSALAYLGMDYNHSAQEILELLPTTAKTQYLLAIVYSRLNQHKKAIDSFLNACTIDSSMRFRGNLDPEIKRLIDKYKIM